MPRNYLFTNDECRGKTPCKNYLTCDDSPRLFRLSLLLRKQFKSNGYNQPGSLVNITVQALFFYRRSYQNLVTRLSVERSDTKAMVLSFWSSGTRDCDPLDDDAMVVGPTSFRTKARRGRAGLAASVGGSSVCPCVVCLVPRPFYSSSDGWSVDDAKTSREIFFEVK